MDLKERNASLSCNCAWHWVVYVGAFLVNIILFTHALVYNLMVRSCVRVCTQQVLHTHSEEIACSLHVLYMFCIYIPFSTIMDSFMPLR